MNNLRGAKIIYQESKATQPSHLYFLQKDENYCEAIVTSESGAKRKLALMPNLTIDQVLANGNTTNQSVIFQSSFGGSDWENTVTSVGNHFKKTNIGSSEVEEIVFGHEGINSSDSSGSSSIIFSQKTKIAYITIPNENGTVVLDYQLNDYYKKTETFSQIEINNLLNNKQNNLGYTPENEANKSDSYTASSSTTYASTKALVDGLATKQKKVTVIPVTGDITLSEIHNGAMLHITNSCIITFAADLGKDFNFVEKAFGSIIVQHVAASGVSLNSDSGLILKNGAMGSVYAPSNNNFILTGSYTTT